MCTLLRSLPNSLCRVGGPRLGRVGARRSAMASQQSSRVDFGYSESEDEAPVAAPRSDAAQWGGKLDRTRTSHLEHALAHPRSLRDRAEQYPHGACWRAPVVTLTHEPDPNRPRLQGPVVAAVEVVDNALDAGATHVEVRVLEAGTLLGGDICDKCSSGPRLLTTDDGCAMHREQMHRCLSLGYTEATQERIGMVRTRVDT